MTKTKTGVAKRIISLLLATLTIITLVFSLSSCGGGKETFTTRNEVTLENGKKVSEDKFVYTAKLIVTNEDYKLRFIAASRGYVIAPAENETALQDNTTPVTDDVAIAEGKKVLDLLIESTNFAKESDENCIKEVKDNLTMQDMKNIVSKDAMKTTYELESDVGFPGVLLIWIGKFLGILTNLFGGSYVLALILFALIVEVVMLPVAIKQQKNMIGMAKLRPAMAKIEKKYAGRNDPVTMQKKREEMMALQQREGYSPFAGCLPMLLQLIIVGFILYPIIQNPIYYMLEQSEDFTSALLYYATSPEAAGGLGFELSAKGNAIELLSLLNKENIVGIANFAPIANGQQIADTFIALDIPNFTIFGGAINLGAIPKIASWLVFVPILNIAGQWLTMFLSKKWNQTGMNPVAQDAQNAASMKIMEILPLALTAFILFQIPAMIGVYWFIRSLISLGKQYLIKLAMPIPKYTEAEIKEMEKMERERQKAQKAALKAQPKVRSLHYIDDDDYEELPQIKNNDATKHVSDDAPEIKD